MQRTNVSDGLVLAGLAAMGVGAWGPWVAHANAGMSLQVSDLVEFVKFMARAGLTGIVRELFYLPLLASAVGIVVWASYTHSQIKTHIALGAALLTLVALPPYPYVLHAYRTPEDRLSFWMSVGALGLVALTYLWGRGGRRAPRRVAAGVLLVLALGSSLPAVWQFIRLSGPLAELYGAPIQVGWGLIVTVFGGLLVVVGSLGELVFPVAGGHAQVA